MAVASSRRQARPSLPDVLAPCVAQAALVGATGARRGSMTRSCCGPTETDDRYEISSGTTTTTTTIIVGGVHSAEGGMAVAAGDRAAQYVAERDRG